MPSIDAPVTNHTPPHTTTDTDLQKVKPDMFTCSFKCLHLQVYTSCTGSIWAWPMIPSLWSHTAVHIMKNLGYCWWTLLQRTASRLLALNKWFKKNPNQQQKTGHLKQTILLIIWSLPFMIKISEYTKSGTSTCPQTSFSLCQCKH